MSRRDIVLLLLIAALLPLCSCARRPASSSNAGTSGGTSSKTPHQLAKSLTCQPTKSGRYVVALVDATASFGSLRESLIRLASFVTEELAMGDTFSAFFIKSKIDDAPCFVVKPTTLPVPTRRIGDPAEAEALAVKQQIRAALLTYANAKEFRKVVKTDFLQSIAYAGRLLHADPNDTREKWLLAFTDMEDTEGKEVELNLKGIHVRVFFVPTRGDLKALEKKIAYWSKRFKDAGAVSLAIYDVGQTRSLAHLLTKL